MALEIRTTKTTQPKAHPPESELGFGKHFSDHALIITWTEGRGWHDARIEPYHTLALDPAASVLHYGQALFEGLKAFRNDAGDVQLFRVQAHAERMARGAPRLCIPALDPADFVAGMKALVSVDQGWVPTSPGTALYLRPTIVADEPFLGVRPSNRYVFFTIASPVGSYYGGDALKPVRIWIENEQVRAARGGLGAVKAAANYAASLQAAVRAKKAGFDQVLWLDHKEHKYVEEVGTMNLFAVFGDTLVTPPLSDSILAGITRDTILALAAGLGVKTEQRQISVDEILAGQKSGLLKEVFGSGTAAVISPVAELATENDKIVIGTGKPGEIALKFYNEITGIQRGTRPDSKGWLTKVVSNAKSAATAHV
ncbi:MAG: branched-chain amino acid aminotransferase [Polyangiaceae bacterium]|nr:branched-chain amino acid aminotransferase [Polyangiaceae bacterium]